MWTFVLATENSELMRLWRCFHFVLVFFSIKSEIIIGSLGEEGLLYFVRMLFGLYT